ncbi:hypothetical protein FOPG_16314 [Fusarium oxysporum f. sp. conglutinans race 2 54008]|uniref:Uncharacterized protein n=3 Tax=Fusarium oxysporum TaxID=5507 RepID=A0A8H6GLA3_FUSOX|nr:hypothetical protein FOVG_10124 [Fusarium oxysporum f. sp. pisi HDV247]EXL67565.1 hypothetical protein FOPG_16314 [Fusarium oxysporum f. sp. conglutinans race 2 54008]KAF6520527.1 hypothetical protein HZS61_014785 [Fusarium oxysporum f. sp. conglutinans]KAG6994332.1 hypothetical protein FocnCong_v016377 [Fusarium oxysporum f. sp. conglutinans]KAI8409108.1 hypothetical protein FOFC_12060 [Fusarium oxysporum]
MRTFTIISTLALILQQAAANLDVVTLVTRSGVYIQEASATLVLPAIPNPISGDVALWSAIMMQNQESFLQGVTENAPAGMGYCTNLGSKWCNFAYALINGSTQPKNGNTVTASPGSRVKTQYKLNSQTQMWDQNVTIDDKLVSHVSTSKGQHGEIFYISMECAQGDCATTPAHSWENVSVTLSKADPSFGQTGSWAQGATGGKMSTSDGGKTWKFTTLRVPATRVPSNDA